jgi:hypothetical protein
MISNKFFLLLIAPLLTASLVRADEIKFQRIRTFDPVRGLVPGNITNSLMAPKISAPGAAPASSATSPSATAQSAAASSAAAPDLPPYQADRAKKGPPSTTDSPAQTVDQQDSNSPPVERSFNNGMLAPAKPDPTPTTTLAPPDAPKRPPPPAVDNNAMLPQIESVNIKPALSWRAKAFKLAALPDSPTDTGKHPSLVMNGSIEDSLNALAQVCKTMGVQLLGKSVPAGQLGARIGDATSGRYLLLFVAKKISNDRTLVKSAMDPDSRPQKTAILQDLLSQAASIVDGKGLL